MSGFWKIPFRFNMGEAMVGSPYDRSKDKTAFIYYDGKNEFKISYKKVDEIGRKIASFLKEKLKSSQNIISLISDPNPNLLFAHVGVYLSGNISMPISSILGDGLIRKRLEKAKPKIILCNKENFERIKALAENSEVYTLDELVNEKIKFASGFKTDETYPETPAMILFTSGSEMEPKGVIHGHKILIARSQIFKYMLQEINGLIWDIADWGWMAGMFYGPFPAMYLKTPFLIYRMRKFDPQEALFVMKKFDVKIIFMPPTALRIMQKELKSFNHKIDSLLTAGEYVGETLFHWVKDFFRIYPTEFYSQTEGGPILANSPKIFPPKPASMGKKIPGVAVKIVDENGNEIKKPGKIGDILVSISSPISMLGYFGEELKVNFGWFKTGDTAYFDDEGYFFYKGRKDKVIKTSGYRISPEEIEDVIFKYAKVDSVVIPKSDETRQFILQILVKEDKTEKIGEIIRKYVGPHIKFEIQKVQEFPKTSTGKTKR